MNPIRLMLSAVFLFFPVVLWNVIYLDYINKSGKLVAYLIAPLFAFIANVIFQGFDGINKPIVKDGYPNAYYAWLTGYLVLSFGIVALSNT